MHENWYQIEGIGVSRGFTSSRNTIFYPESDNIDYPLSASRLRVRFDTNPHIYCGYSVKRGQYESAFR